MERMNKGKRKVKRNVKIYYFCDRKKGAGTENIGDRVQSKRGFVIYVFAGRGDTNK